MQEEPSLYPDKGMFPDKREQPIISLEESSFILKRSLWHPSEGSHPNTKDTKRCSVKKSRKGYPDTPFGIMLLSYSQEPLHLYLGGSFLLPKAKSPKHRSL